MSTTASIVVQFEVGKSYFCRSICDHDCVWTFTIARRTKSTITTKCGKTLRIIKALSTTEETVFPMGNYSMCPVLRASKLA